MAAVHRNREHSAEISYSQSQSNMNEPSSSASFLADNREILREMKQPTTMKLMSSEQENSHSVSQRQMHPMNITPKYPRGRFVRVNSRDRNDNKHSNHHNNIKEHSVSKSKSKTRSKTNTNRSRKMLSSKSKSRPKTNGVMNRKNCCGYPEHKSDEPPMLNLSLNEHKTNKLNHHKLNGSNNRKSRANMKRRPKHNMRVTKYSDNDDDDTEDDSYNINNDIIAGLQKSRRSKSISDSNGNDEQKEVMEHLEKYRKLNGVIFGRLDKFPGNEGHKLKFNKPKGKFVVYVPQKQLLFYAKNKDPNDQTTIISVKGIEINDINITRQLKKKYRDKYFKVIGHTRIVLFAAGSNEHAQTWYKVIRNSLSINIKLIEPRLTLNDQYYIDGWLGKFQGDSNDNIKFKKDATAKYVIFIPQMKLLFFCGEQKNKVKTTLVHIQKITRKNKYISRYMPDEFKNTWFKVIGLKRIVVFVAQSDQERDIWFTQILKALYPTSKDHALTDNDYQESSQLK